MNALPNSARNPRLSQSGISYMEVLVATILIAVALVPALQALNAGLQGPDIHKQRARNHYLLMGKLEEVLTQPFDSLDAAGLAVADEDTPTSYSDPDTEKKPVSVYIWRYDVDDADLDDDPFTGGEADILWLRVDLEKSNQSLETLLSRY